MGYLEKTDFYKTLALCQRIFGKASNLHSSISGACSASHMTLMFGNPGLKGVHGLDGMRTTAVSNYQLLFTLLSSFCHTTPAR